MNFAHFLFLFSGNSKPTHPHNHSTIKDLAGSILGDDSKSKDDSDLWGNVEAQTAFLGPNLWDKSYDTDLKVIKKHIPFPKLQNTAHPKGFVS